MLTIESFDHHLGQRQLFRELDLRVAPGEHIVIVGDSGSGKSTLLKLIADRSHTDILMDAETSSTMVMQQGALLDHLKVLENLQLVARYANRDARPKQLLEQLNIDSSLHNQSVSQLSGGQMRRVAIARALVTRPHLLLFDEPDAGLDIANLTSLGATVARLTDDGQSSAITISHNPFYIAQIADRVYRLVDGKLSLIADWQSRPTDREELRQRQLQLQDQLREIADNSSAESSGPQRQPWIVGEWLKGIATSLRSLLHWPRSIVDELRIAGYTYYLSFITGAIFYALVGLMLGSTVIAVVKMLTDSALTGVLAVFITPERILDMMGGVYVLYLGPAIGGMLYAARSGSIISNWLGELVRGRQVQALEYLQVPPQQYLTAPSLLAMYAAMVTTILWFSLGLWVGGLIAAKLLFGVADPVLTLQIEQFEIDRSLYWLKVWLYSALVSVTVIALGMAPKSTAHQVNIYTTKAIIYSTLSISFAELVIILS